MLYTNEEYATYRKVRAFLHGQRRYGWVSITARVHPDDAEKVRAYLAEVEAARRAELLAAMDQADAARAERKAGQRAKLNGHTAAVLDLARRLGTITRADIRDLMASRVPAVESRRVLQSRALRRLLANGQLRLVGKYEWQYCDRQADKTD